MLDGSLRGNAEQGIPPGCARHIALLDRAIAATDAKPRHSAKVIAATAFALMGGWFILEDWLVPASGLSDRDISDLRREVADLLKELVAQASGLEPSVR